MTINQQCWYSIPYDDEMFAYKFLAAPQPGLEKTKSGWKRNF